MLESARGLAEYLPVGGMRPARYLAPAAGAMEREPRKVVRQVPESIVIEKNVMVAMPDGIALATDIYRPRTDVPLPVLLQRTPYDKDFSTIPDIVRMARAGYCVAVQDTRGCFASEGTFEPFTSEAADGAAFIDWAASQPWSNGTIATFGASYVGATQWLAATRAHQALRGLAPLVTASDYHEGWTYQGGAFEIGFALHWALGFALSETQRRIAGGTATPGDRERILDAIGCIDSHYERHPLAEMPVLAATAPYYGEWLRHPEDDAYWQRIAPRKMYEQITVPALNMGGWYDIFAGGTLANYRGMKERGGSALARSGQRLIMGPWAHGVDGDCFPWQYFGPRAGTRAVTVDLVGAQIRWFDYVLKGIDDGISREPPVQIFVMGSNAWRKEADWPLPGTIYHPYYLHSSGRANSLSGDGTLTTTPPADEECDVYLYDPRRPVPTCGGATLLSGLWVGANSGPRDQRTVEVRSDVLCYTSAPLDRATEVTGHVTLQAFVSSTARDTDFTAKLVDVSPDGTATILTDGILRARYRESLATPVLMVPETVYDLRIDVGATANLFAAGHQVRLEISSSNFPRFDRNTNTGGKVATDRRGDVLQAVNRVWHDRLHPSRLILPVVERE